MEDPESLEFIDRQFDRINSLKELGRSRSLGSLWPLVKALSDEHKWIRHHAREAIYELTDWLLNYQYEKYRFGTLVLISEALAEAGDERSIPVLQRIVKEAGEWKLQKETIKSLRKLGNKFPEATNILDSLPIIKPPVSDFIIEIPAGEITPYVHFDREKGTLLMSGRAYDRDIIIDTIRLLSDEFDKFVEKYPQGNFVASYYFKSFYDEIGKPFIYFLDKLSKHRRSMVYWYYEINDQEMMEMGEDLIMLSHVPVKLIGIPEGEEVVFDFPVKT
jgi:hypothetical protein